MTDRERILAHEDAEMTGKFGESFGYDSLCSICGKRFGLHSGATCPQDMDAAFYAADDSQSDLNTALSLLSVYAQHLTSCHVWTEVVIDGRLIGPAYPCTCGYAERVAPFLQRMSEVKK